MRTPLATHMRPTEVYPPKFKEHAHKDGTTPLHPGWLPVLARVPLFASLSKRHLRHVADLAELRALSSTASQIVRAGAQRQRVLRHPRRQRRGDHAGRPHGTP